MNRRRVQTVKLDNGVTVTLLDDGNVTIETPSWVSIRSWCGSTGSSVELELGAHRNVRVIEPDSVEPLAKYGGPE